MSGLSTKKVAKELGCGSATVWAALHRWGVPLRQETNKGPRYPIVNGQRFCPKCKRWKNLDQFAIHKLSKAGRQACCKTCFAVRHREAKYGMDSGAYDELYFKQRGLCACCGQPETQRMRRRLLLLAVDHCHKTGKVRALLCHRCNRILGGVDDNPYILWRMIDYLSVHSETGSQISRQQLAQICVILSLLCH